MSTDHRAEALAALALIQAADNPSAEISSSSEATAHALLAIEARLGELVGEQRTANLIAAFQSRALDSPAEFERARELIKALLGPIPNDGTNADRARARWLAEQARPHHRPDRTDL